MKTIFLFATILLSSSIVFSQEVKFKKSTISFDGTECIKYDSEPTYISYMDLNGKTIIILKYIKTYKVSRGLYNQIIFPELNLSLTCASYIFTKKDLIKHLAKDKVFLNCNLDSEKVKLFILKFDEKIE